MVQLSYDVLINSEMEAGDFVRWCKQVKDLLIQVENAGLPSVSLQCVVARNAINRSVVSCHLCKKRN